MITIKKLFEKYAEHLVDSDHEFEGYFIDEEDFILAVKEYTREAIKADRENVAKYAETKEKRWSRKCSSGYEYGYNTIVDKKSIINAPEIELL